MTPKQNYKGSLFRHMFKEPERLRHLYRSLTGRDIPVEEITVNTLKGTFMNDVKNDISFLAGGRLVILIEHQSTWNPNMAIRMLWYLGNLYRDMIDKDLIYRSTLVQIPAPECYILYNGTKDEPDFQSLRLSDAFLTTSLYAELVVDCYNINYAPSREILNSCYELRCYSAFVEQTRKGIREGLSLGISLRRAIRYCETHDLMTDYFTQNEREVFDMVSFEWNQQRANEIAREEGREEGQRNTISRIVLNLFRKKYSISDIADTTDISTEDVRKILRDHGLVA